MLPQRFSVVQKVTRVTLTVVGTYRFSVRCHAKCLNEAAETSVPNPVPNHKSQGELPSKFLAEKKKKAAEPLVTAAASAEVQQVPFESLKVNDFLAVVYDSHWWICCIERIGEDEIFVHFMSPFGPKPSSTGLQLRILSGFLRRISSVG